jgi:hypothetical protein
MLKDKIEKNNFKKELKTSKLVYINPQNMWP